MLHVTYPLSDLIIVGGGFYLLFFVLPSLVWYIIAGASRQRPSPLARYHASRRRAR